MFAVGVLFLLFLSGISGHVVFKCSDNDEATPMSLTKSENVHWRYRAEACIPWTRDMTQWSIDLMYFQDASLCDRVTARKMKIPAKHSTVVLTQSNSVFERIRNCSAVCTSIDFDLVFNACFVIISENRTKTRSFQPVKTYYKITDSSSKDYVANTVPCADVSFYGTNVNIKWHTGVPTTAYKVELYKVFNSQNEVKEELQDHIQHNCTQDDIETVRCEFPMGEQFGNYSALFTHLTPWARGGTFPYFFDRQFEYTGPGTVQLSARRSRRVWWACGGALLAAAALLAALACRGQLAPRSLHKRLLYSMQHRARERSSEEAAEAVVDNKEGNGPVLLLYAREDEVGQRAVDALKALLEEAGLEVLDVFSAEAAALCAAAPAAWLSNALRDARVRVLLLQTPALAALYHAPGHHLRAPLLNTSVMYRVPQFGDQLLQLALRLISESAHEHSKYHKYYIASLSSLPVTEVLEGVVRYRRYALPAAAQALLRDLTHTAHTTRSDEPGTASPCAGAVEALRHAAEEFALHVTNKPDYLMDELQVL